MEIAWDREQDIIYVIKAHRLRGSNASRACAAPFGHGASAAMVWPRDGRRETLEGAGIALPSSTAIRAWTCSTRHAQFEDGSVSVEAGLMDMLTRMETGGSRSSVTCNDWFEEFRLYHRKDGKVVKEGDDLMAATRYA